MPLARISLRRGKPASYRKAILEGIYQALRDTFDVPEGDRFMILTEHDEDDFVYDANYLGIRRRRSGHYPDHCQQHAPDGTKAEAISAHRRTADRESGPARRGYFHQPDRGASGKLVVRPWRGAIRPMTAMPALSTRISGIHASRASICAAGPASCGRPGATLSSCPRATSTLRCPTI